VIGAPSPSNKGEDDVEVDLVGEQPDAETLLVGPEGIDDPETEWVLEESDEPLPELSDDEIWLLAPGEDLLVVTNLPKARQLPLAIAIRPGEIVVCTGRRREWSRTPIGASSNDDDLPLADTVLLVFIRHRARGVKTKPRKYVIVTGVSSDGEAGEGATMLGRLDYSDAWNFEGGLLKRMIEATGLDYQVERYSTEPEFERAHPDWVR
jgi:hypothetical protein